MSDLSRVRHLLVDLDGTLLESRDLPLRLDFTRRTLGELSRHGGWVRAVRALHAVRIELEKPGAPSAATNQERASLAFAQALGVPPGQGGELLHSTITGLFPSLKRHFYPVPGAKDFLDWARSRYPLTLATNPIWPLAQVKLRLEWAGIDPGYFGAITHAGSMHACKPSAEYYREVIGPNDPTRYLLIGDDVRKDLPAARIGIPVFILGRRSRPLQPGPGAAATWMGGYPELRALLAAHGPKEIT